MSNVKSYTKKPVTIEAIQWTGENLDVCAEFLGGHFLYYSGEQCIDGTDQIFINTLEGHIIASKGDYLIRGVKGEHYPCKPDIFEATYSLAIEDDKMSVFTIENLKEELNAIIKTQDRAKPGEYDPEADHCDADDLLIKYIAQQDEEIKTLFDSIHKWYA